MKKIYHSIGLMSGTSLDGLDIALCQFENYTKNNSSLWNYKIIKTEFVEYDKTWKNKLQNAHLLSAFELKKLETEWTDFLVKKINKFVLQSKMDFTSLDCLSSHGHTVFHQPIQKNKNQKKEQLGFTLQIGNGAMLAEQTGFRVVCDFRQTDVALGGQGAPLVPIGDELLFSDYDFCLNLGGIANISFNKDKKNINSRFAFDICPCNMVLNYLSSRLGFEYDEGGKLAKKGKIDKKLLQKLNDLEFYKQDYPKSLGREWVEKFVFPLLETEILSQNELVIKDLLHTCTYHSAFQIAESITKIELTLPKMKTKRKLLITGGGAYNDLLIDYLNKLLPTIEVEKGSETLIAYKEALIFAFLGVLRLRGETNTLASVTGATKNSCGGSIYLAESEVAIFLES
ncbi:molecular chaperone [Bernardetia litoralis DSM 6794]|uniref:Molecular chaperone n=1 Tax=Bernardetia litoralis (strain ATCC 23117 / DSM 6794 / NBRC 15988 / NCIMB 1366 / Fx l1 / Sio-4) TaxID=880071 RepID=I4ANA9_BERLS|nr:anhydro-N-acetylmuramic acid kinase [Bernardetia litoralis]AFM05444.1 molecular chaperone [Bernardetia litoralis DSM 6794]